MNYSSQTVYQKRDTHIDLLKTIAIMMVIALHIPVWKWNFYSDGSKIFEKWVQYCFRLASEGVPIFFMVNGYLLFGKNYEYRKHENKSTKLLIMFVLWAAIQSINVAIVNKTEISFPAIINHIITLDYPFTLWFYKYLLFIYLLFPALKSIFDKSKALFAYLFYLSLFFTTAIHFMEGANYCLDYIRLGWLKGLNGFLTDFFPLNARGAASITFFMLGGVLNMHKESIKSKKIIWIGLGLIAWIILCVWYTFLSNIRGQVHEYFWFGNICEVFFCIGIYAFTLLFNYGQISKKILGIIGSNTNGIYLLHIIILPWIANPFNGELLIGRFGHLIVIMCISLFLSIVLGRIPLIKKAIKF